MSVEEDGDIYTAGTLTVDGVSTFNSDAKIYRTGDDGSGQLEIYNQTAENAVFEAGIGGSGEGFMNTLDPTGEFELVVLGSTEDGTRGAVTVREENGIRGGIVNMAGYWFAGVQGGVVGAVDNTNMKAGAYSNDAGDNAKLMVTDGEYEVAMELTGVTIMDENPVIYVKDGESVFNFTVNRYGDVNLEGDLTLGDATQAVNEISTIVELASTDLQLPTAAAVYNAIETAIDGVTLQVAYDNGREIIAENGPMQIRTADQNGGLDVFAEATSDNAIDANIVDNGIESDQAAVIGSLQAGPNEIETDYFGALGVKTEVLNLKAGVAGYRMTSLDEETGRPTIGALAATAYDFNTDQTQDYAGFFVGNVGMWGIDNVATGLPVLFVTDDPTQAMPSGDGYLVHLYGTDETATGSVLNVHTDTKAKGNAIYAETTGEDATGLMVTATNGVGLENASVIIDKGPGAGSALIAQGEGLGSIVFINDYTISPFSAQNNYALEVTKSLTADAAIFASNQAIDGYALEASGNVKISRDPSKIGTEPLPLLMVTDDLTTYQGLEDDAIVHLYAENTTSTGAVLNVHNNSEAGGVAIYASTQYEDAVGLLVKSNNGVAAENASVIIDKGQGNGSALVAQGEGLGSIVFINDYTGSPISAQNSYGLEVTKSATADAGIFVSNEHIDGDEIADGTALKVGKGKVVLSSTDANESNLADMGAYSIINYISTTDYMIDLTELPDGEDGQTMYLINGSAAPITINGYQMAVGDMVMVINYASTWHVLTVTSAP